MAGMSDEIEVLIVPNLKTSGVEKQTKEIAKMFENNIGKPLDASLEKYFKNINGQLVTFVKTGNKYKRLALDVDKKKNITGVSGLSGSYSKAEAQKLLKQEVRQEEVRLKEIEAVRKKREKTRNEKQSRERAKQFSELIGSQLSGKDRIRFDISQNEDYLKVLEKEFETVGKRTKRFKELQYEISETQKRINLLKKDLQKEIKIGGFEKLINTFKRVGFYRLARRLFQVIEQGLSESITNLAKFDTGVNDTMSNLTSSFTILSNSLAVVVYPLLKMVEPILRGLSETVGKVANSVSYLVAKLTGSSKFLKVNTQYLKDFNKEMNLLSFDKFEALNEDADISSMFDEVDIDTTSFSEELGNAKDILVVIGTILGGYETIKFVNWLMNKLPTAVKDVGKISDSLSKTSSLQFSGTTTMLTVLGTTIAGIGAFKLFDWLLKDATKAQSILITIVGVLLSIAMIFTFIRSLSLGNVAGAMASAIGAGAGLGIMIAGAKNTAQKSVGVYANGGIAEKGDLFIANEAGPELVYSGPNNSSSIMNIAQFRQATVEALYEWWSDAKYDIPEGSTTYLDGAQIARSKSFKNELNRTNSGLNLR